MKHLLLISIAAVCLLSCRKNIDAGNQQLEYLKNIEAGLKDSLSAIDYANIDFNQSIITKTDSDWSLLRIPFDDKKLYEEFVLLQTDGLGKILKGFIINLSQNSITNDNKYVYNGNIKISHLNRTSKLISQINNGYISAFNPGIQRRAMVVPSKAEDEPNVLPDVTVTCYVSSGGGSFSSYNSINLGSLFGTSYGGSSSYNSSGYYSSMDGTGGGGSGNGGYYGNSYDESYSDQEYPSHGGHHGDFVEDEPELVDFEFVEDLSPIDITKYLKCFSNIPDQGSTCSIEIFTDIPVDENSNKLFNWRTQSPGHTFLQIKKTNGNVLVMQNIGFYPVEGWKTLLTTAPVEGKFVDNSEHEYNASFKMNLTPGDLQKTLDNMVYLSRFVKYDIDEFNCTDFALNVFNTTRISNALEIPKYHIPGGTAINGTNTPQGLYKQLQSMQQQGIESNNITIPGAKAFVADATGPCN